MVQISTSSAPGPNGPRWPPAPRLSISHNQTWSMRTITTQTLVSPGRRSRNRRSCVCGAPREMLASPPAPGAGPQAAPLSQAPVATSLSMVTPPPAVVVGSGGAGWECALSPSWRCPWREGSPSGEISQDWDSISASETSTYSDHISIFTTNDSNEERTRTRVGIFAS